MPISIRYILLYFLNKQRYNIDDRNHKENSEETNMKLKKLTLLSIIPAATICLSGCTFKIGNFIVASNDSGKLELFKKDDGNENFTVNKEHIEEYYSDIDNSKSGDALLKSLRTLNLSKREKTVGYGAMGTSASGKFKFTDYDPSTVKYTNDGVPYGTKILSFYTGQVLTTTFTREHVWPASRLPGGREGNIVDDDIYMPRPESNGNNGTRGNSVYGTTGGWDPVKEFGESNCYQGTSIRGECARIIFYCLLVDDRLTLDNDTSYSPENGKMGKIDDLVKWSVENPVNEREQRRNVGGEYLQGNRNAFVDHPEYVCKIWGTKSSATRKACGL